MEWLQPSPNGKNEGLGRHPLLHAKLVTENLVAQPFHSQKWKFMQRSNKWVNGFTNCKRNFLFILDHHTFFSDLWLNFLYTFWRVQTYFRDFSSRLLFAEKFTSLFYYNLVSSVWHYKYLLHVARSKPSEAYFLNSSKIAFSVQLNRHFNSLLVTCWRKPKSFL